MSKNITDNNLVADAKSAVTFWEAHPEINLNETSCAQFKKAQAAFQKLTDEIAQQQIELTAKLTERDQLGKVMRVAISRLRSGVRAFYGPDSKEYEQIGCTRASARKRPSRRNDLEGVGVAIPARNTNTNGNGNGNGHSEVHAEQQLT